MEYQKKISNKQQLQTGGTDIGSVEQPDTDYDNFYSEVMNPRDVIANILRNLKDPNVSGVVGKIQDDKFILTVVCYEDPSDDVLKDMIGVANEAIKYIKKKYKDATGTNLKMKKVADVYDVVGAYTTNRKAQINYTLTFDIGGNKNDGKVNSLDKEIGYDDNRKIDFKVA